ncbi:hypothetical protein O181_001235 [Austropuccinia psidii MF-1]|uniref:Uncharacterized protein n=1 Tax=Austropuccinia psidii MF-1 TaxID=1389203 RepID=A0A9Q3BAL4_9BASI|nr:hypothetical protein [Austropuccinia psidii MF-1]
MSSSGTHKSHSGSFHDSGSESSIEYVQSQSPMSLKIPLTTPIASINIDVQIATAQDSSSWSIPNISVAPIPPNSTNTQIHVSEGPGSTRKISFKANPQSKFSHDLLLNLGGNLLGQVKIHQDLRFMSAMKNGLMVGDKKDH